MMILLISESRMMAHGRNVDTIWNWYSCSFLTGLVIDYEMLSKYCPECTTAKRDLGENCTDFSIWYKAHKPECSENCAGSSNAMEVKAAKILWH
ncbi:hypothetical protein AVEN_167022-1 [Araneus ventricosus]|uniref:Uncharacterized protein n=1 Tax=Araneus ventricosus TaxID=182803 RepID=A0A4Y2QL80_ARAVE|nr:hypothetical protein AVEN_167022-1 [Araneus ventricosus]